MLKASGARKNQTILEVYFYGYEKSLRGDFQEPMAYVFFVKSRIS